MKLCALVLVLTTATASAQIAPPPPSTMPACDVAAVEADRAALDRERRSARNWNTGWTIAYAAMAGVQLVGVAIEFSPGKAYTDATRDNLYIGAGKATIGALSRLVIPLRIPRVARSADPCADAPALAHARAVAHRKERNTFWLQLGGGAALHLIGGGYLVVHDDAWREALMSLALGAVISTITLYTEPKTSWRHHRDVSVVPMPARDGLGVAVVGAF